MASLGTLTLDIVAKTSGFVAGLSKAERASKKWKNQVRRDLQDVGRRFKTGLSVGAVAAAAGIAVVVQKSRQAIDEQAKLAKQLNTTSESLANLKRAGELSGVAFKQITTAGRQLDVALAKAAQGEATYADAVNSLGLSVEDLIDLPLDQKLNAVNKALLENVKRTERAAVAADLFGTRNGAAIRQLQPEVIAQAAEEVRVFGLNLSDVDAAKVELANDSISRISLAAKGAGQQLTIALAPAIDAVGDAFFNAAKEADGMGNLVQEAVDDVISGLAFVIDAADGIGRAFEIAADLAIAAISGLAAGAAETLADFLKYASYIPGIDFSETEASVRRFVADQVGVFNAAGENIRRNLEEPLAGNAIRDAYAAAKVEAEAAAEASAKAAEALREQEASGSSVELNEIKVLAVKREISKELEEIIQKNQDYWGLVKSLRTDEEEINDTLRERLAIIESFPGEDTGETRARAIAATAIEPPETSGLDPSVGGPTSELARLNDERTALDEWYANELDRYKKFREDKLYTEQEYNTMSLEAKQQYEDAIAGIEQARQTASLVAAETMFGNLADVTRQFAGEQSAAYKVLFAIEKGAAIARSIVAIQTALAQAATSGPFPANLAAMASVAAATGSLISTIASTSIQGQAHDGLMSVPSTGTYILERGERVTTAETSAKMDKMIDDAREGGMGGGVRIINTFDSQEVVGSYLGSSAGERTVMNIVKRNQATLRSLG